MIGNMQTRSPKAAGWTINSDGSVVIVYVAAGCGGAFSVSTIAVFDF